MQMVRAPEQFHSQWSLYDTTHLSGGTTDEGRHFLHPQILQTVSQALDRHQNYKHKTHSVSLFHFGGCLKQDQNQWPTELTGNYLGGGEGGIM